MSLFPTTTPTKEAERRAERILEHGVECHDRQLLGELWNELRDAEAAQRPGPMRDRLTRIRSEVGAAIAEIESESMRGRCVGPKSATA